MGVGASDCVVALPLRGYSTVLADAGAVEALGEAAATQCPASCGQCDSTRRGCLQFSPGFLTVLGVFQNVSSLLGAILFQRLLASLPLRVAFVRIALVLPLAAACDLILAMRWNAAVGLDDHLFAGVDTVLYYTASSLKTVAVYTLVTAICPPFVEATLFSWIMGGMYLGSLISQWFGAWVAAAAGISADDYSALWAICSVRVGCLLGSLLLIPLVPTEAAVAAAVGASVTVRQEREGEVGGVVEGGGREYRPLAEEASC